VRTVSDFSGIGCKLMESGESMFTHIFNNTNGDPCATGCAWFDNGKCPAHIKLLLTKKPKVSARFIETVRERGKRLGISISKIRKPSGE